MAGPQILDLEHLAGFELRILVVLELLFLAILEVQNQFGLEHQKLVVLAVLELRILAVLEHQKLVDLAVLEHQKPIDLAGYRNQSDLDLQNLVDQEYHNQADQQVQQV